MRTTASTSKAAYVRTGIDCGRCVVYQRPGLMCVTGECTGARGVVALRAQGTAGVALSGAVFWWSGEAIAPPLLGLLNPCPAIGITDYAPLHLEFLILKTCRESGDFFVCVVLVAAG